MYIILRNTYLLLGSMDVIDGIPESPATVKLYFVFGRKTKN